MHWVFNPCLESLWVTLLSVCHSLATGGPRFLDPEDTEACPEQMMRALRECTVQRDLDDVPLAQIAAQLQYADADVYLVEM